MLLKGPWLFVLIFALVIGVIQSLGWWTRPTAPAAEVSQSRHDPFTSPGALRHLHGEPKHWRKLVMQP